MNADDLFAGAGGWDLAAQNLGIHARGIENMPAARATRDAAGLTTIHDDVWTYEPDGTAEGLIASPPCQTFSAAGKGAGRKALDGVLSLVGADFVRNIDHLREFGAALGEERTALVLTPLHFALTSGYEWLAWEQVPTVLPVWEACAERLRADGWHVWTGMLNAEQYGVPQTRKRAFLLASLRGPVTPPAPTHSRYHSLSPERIDEGVPRWVSMAEALGWGMTHRPSTTLVCGMNGGGADPMSGGSGSRAIHRRARESGQFIEEWQRSNYCAWEWRGEGPAPELPEWAFNRPSKTIVGSFKPEIVAAPGYRTTVSRQNAPNSVRVTVHEAGVLQSFPADFPWQGAKGKQFLQAGNAVPPGLALHALAAATHAQLDGQVAA